MTGERFRKHREALGLSQPALGKAMGLSNGRQTISDWENDRMTRGIPGPAAELMRAFVKGHRPGGKPFPNDKVK